jgi:glycerol-3-phosphate cytidylyltransferase
MIYCFDIDGTICSSVQKSKYEEAQPFSDVIQHINNLYDNGHEIIVMSARGSVRKVDYFEFTKKQLDSWGLKYNKLLMNIKPHADYFIDDKAINIEDYRKMIKVKIGFVAGCFDVIHPGYIKMFKQIKENCNHLIVGLHEDPTNERKEKNKPVLSVEERKEILMSLKYVDEIFVYKTEQELYEFLKENKIDVRFLGTDYTNKKFTGDDLNINIQFIDRDHGWSSTKFKLKIKESL